MKLTNRNNYPPELAGALEDAMCAPHAWPSVTTLQKPLLQTILEYRHREEIVRDVEDGAEAADGSAMHAWIHAAAVKRGMKDMSEMGLRYVTHEGHELRGTADMVTFLDPGNCIVRDYKTTKAYKIYLALTTSEARKEWEAQLNCYAFMLRAAGIPVKALEVQAWARDWERPPVQGRIPWKYSDRTRMGTNYPGKWTRIPLELWDYEDQRAYVEDRLWILMQHVAHADIPGICEDRWVDKQGDPLRCWFWCDVWPWCPHAPQKEKGDRK